MTDPFGSNPSDDESLLGVLNTRFEEYSKAHEDMLPARIIEYDRANNRAQVQPLIQLVTTAGEVVDRPAIVSVPVLQLGGGGFAISFNLPPGSLGWIKAADRDLSLFLQAYDLAPPNDRRFHSFAASMFIPDVMTGYQIAGEDDQALVIQNADGTIKISIDDQRIKLEHPQMVEIVTPETFVDGDLTVNGDVDSTGTVTASTDVVGGGISLVNHVHVGSPTAPTGAISNTGAAL